MVPQNTELAAALDELNAKLPQLIAAYPIAADFWDAFGEKANQITDSAPGGAAAVYAQGRLVAMLRDAGMLPEEARNVG